MNTELKNYSDTNYLLLSKLSNYLNKDKQDIDEDMVNNLSKEIGIDNDSAYRILLATFLDVSENEDIMTNYFPLMLKKLDVDDYIINPYYRNIELSDIDYKNWKVKMASYKPYELFVYDDLLKLDDGRIIPHIGYFEEEYFYPVIYQNDREWMLITPNEINTMKYYIDDAFGDVTTYGLGLGYYAYMASNKENVKKVTIVENDREVIALFKKYILPQFKNKEKIKIICEDAFIYSSKHIDTDYVFVDIWHDPTDGIELYKQFKMIERPNIKYGYWIEKTMKCYMK